MTIRWAGILLALVSVAARAEVVDINWTYDGRFGYEALLAAGGSVEICGPLSVADTVEWTLKSDTPLDINIHYHLGEDVVYPLKESGATDLQHVLSVEVAQTYCWMLTNSHDKPAVIQLDLERNTN